MPAIAFMFAGMARSHTNRLSNAQDEQLTEICCAPSGGGAA
jgi:hypothetical protein